MDKLLNFLGESEGHLVGFIIVLILIGTFILELAKIIKGRD